MEDNAFRAKYQLCKYKVKLWEKQFMQKYNRVPSKLDIRESPNDIKYSYRMYYQLKTNLLKNTLLDALDDDDDFDSSLISQESSFSLDVPEGTIRNSNELSDKHVSMSNLLTKPIGSTSSETFFEAEEQTAHNLTAWKEEKSRKPQPLKGESQKENTINPSKPVVIKKTTLMSASNMMIPKRNPRKSMSRNSFGSLTLNSLSSGNAGNGQKNVIPDLETLLIAKTKELEPSTLKEEEKPRTVPSSQPLTEPINQLDERWLNRQSTGFSEFDLPSSKQATHPEQTVTVNYGLRNVNLASFGSSSSFGMSSLTVSDKEKPTTTQAPGPIDVLNTAYDRPMHSDSDGVVENSEDESTKTSPSMMHVAKKRKLFTAKSHNSNEELDSKSKLATQQEYQIPTKNNNVVDQHSHDTVERESESKDKPLKKRNTMKTFKDKSKQRLKKMVDKTKAAVIPRTRSMRTNARKVASRKEHYLEDDLENDHVGAFSSDDEDKDPNYEINNTKNDDFLLEEEEHDLEVSSEKVSRPKLVRRARNVVPTKQRQKRRAVKKPSVISPKLSPGSSTASSKLSKTKKITRRKITTEDDEINDTNEPEKYVPEFGIDRIKSIPRIDIDELVKDTHIADRFITGTDTTHGATLSNKIATTTSINAKEAALRKKMAAGKLNENFVRIDLRKKVFVKGKKTINYSRYKKSQWKAKKVAALSGPNMDMRGCDGGVLTCFNCGGTGHMARQCKKPTEDKLLPYEVDEMEDSSFPTLQEAEAMAKSRTMLVHSNRIESLPPVANPSWKISNDEEQDTKHDDDMLMDSAEVVLQGEDNKENDQHPVDAGVSQSAYIGHKIPEDFLKQSGILETCVVGGSKDKIKPVYEQQMDGKLPPTPPEVLEVLRMFGHKNFRHGQEKAVMRVLCGMSTLVTLSTGAGKSLCYQLPAYLYRRNRACITLVISPLVSLMEDQVHGMPDFLNAQCLHTNQTPKVRENTMEAIAGGKVDILLISPEAVVSGEKSTGFGSLLRQLPPIAFACIDEAHCVSQWSHNFRPSYLMICKVLKEKLGVKTILGLTATATVQTRQSIVSHLAIPDGLNGIISDIPLPDNLLLTVSRDANRDAALVELLLSERFNSLQSIIVYCTRRDDCERVATFIRTCFQDAARAAAEANANKRKRLNYVAEPYHAGMPASRRRTIQNAFMSGDLRIVVATIAFGMGINKADIRAIIHYNMPKNFESYVQEVGRAGRDGMLSHCHLFLDNQGKDRNELRRFIYANSIDRHVIRKLLQKIFVPCACAKMLKNKYLANKLRQEIEAVNGVNWDTDFDDLPTMSDEKSSVKSRKRVCPGHEICFPIESTIQQLDIPEENIATFLCYLELDGQRYIQALSPAYTMCKVMSYGGVRPLRQAAKECPPLAMAFALDLKRGISHATSTVIEFPVIDVAAAIGWNSGVVKHQLKNLEWTSVNNVSKRSPLTVTFFELGFRVRAPGDLSDDELDCALDGLYERVTCQERTQLAQLQYIAEALNSVSFNTISPVRSADCPTGPSDKLKSIVREYFLTDISKENKEIIPEPDDTTDEQLLADIRTTICRYPENNFTGRAIARIFHGVQSPNYPALIWSRSNFWRSYTKTDFNRIVRLANAEIVRKRLNGRLIFFNPLLAPIVTLSGAKS
ncbi:uncharacterized protein LOC128724638 [Anopheles nili]|uniref:uncharacterized protein LOC128724638 n=1 Tax=Anopheles nili TaxID=185578 RepID=UPI00237A6338|nr:uncharacterized protein LOC128724638 [Anopheles nili]